MKVTEILNILPLIILAASVLLVLLATAFRRNHLLINILSLAGLLLSAISMSYVPAETQQIGTLLTMDGFGRLFILLVLFACIGIVVICYGYLEKQVVNKEEYYVILLSGALGASVLGVANHFIAFFLGLEILSVSLFILVSYLKSERGIEAAIKYLLLAGVSSAFLLMGMAMLYSQTGAMNFEGMAKIFAETGVSHPLVLMGFTLFLVGAGFKLGLVPFHLWTPDVYEGAPAPTSAFIASVSKGSMVAILIRFFMAWEGFYFGSMVLGLSVLAVLSILIGNILALRQQNVKRILAYSSIAHLGYILIALIAGGERGVEAAGFYLLAYFATIIGAFGIVAMMSGKDQEASELGDYKGLFWRKPLTAAIFSVFLLSLAGIPLTAGFIWKFYILSAGVYDQLWVLSLVLVLGSVIGLYYYLRIIVQMFRPAENLATQPKFSNATNVVLVLMAVVVFWLGVNPQSLIELIKTAVISSFIP